MYNHKTNDSSAKTEPGIEQITLIIINAYSTVIMRAMIFKWKELQVNGAPTMEYLDDFVFVKLQLV